MSENQSNTESTTKKPPTEKQLAANRANALKSTGPKTEEGKSASRENALKHGMCTRRTLLPCESPAEYAQLLADFMIDCQPVGQREVALVGHIMAAQWSMMRAQALECSIFDMEIDHAKKKGNHPNPSDRTEDFKALALGFLKEPEKHMRSFFRYSSQSERSFYRALKELRDLQNDRLRREQLLVPKAKPKQAEPETETEEVAAAPLTKTAGVQTAAATPQIMQNTTSQPAIGFVAQIDRPAATCAPATPESTTAIQMEAAIQC